jgi:hypothetical protein
LQALLEAEAQPRQAALSLGLRDGLGAVLLAAAKGAAVMVGCGALMWLAGYFGIKGAQFHLYGTARYDLLTPLCTHDVWSQWFPSIPCTSRANDWDGESFLGIGTLAVLAISLGTLAVRRRWAAPSGQAMPRWPLLLVGVLLLAFAATNEVAIGGRELFSYPVPRRWLEIAETFRGSGRMIWPVFYAGLFAILTLFARTVPARFHAWILLPLALVQAYDMRPGLRLVHARLEEQLWSINDLRSPAWAQLGHYQRLISVPAGGGQAGWHDLVWQAAKHGLASNMGLFNRVDAGRAAAGRKQWLASVISGKFDPQAVYVFPEEGLWQLARQIKGPSDVALIADGHHLLFPGGSAFGLIDDSSPPPPPLALDRWHSVAAHGEGNRYLSNGWSWYEKWGRWNTSELAGLSIPLPEDQRGRECLVALEIIPYTDRSVSAQRYRVLAWNTVVAEGELTADDSILEIIVPANLTTKKSLFLELQLPDATAASDGRLLSIAVKRLWISLSGKSPSLLTEAQQQLVDAPPPAAWVPFDEWREVGANQPGERLLLSGWSWPEPWGRWSAHRSVSLAIPQAGELGQPVTIKLDVLRFGTKAVSRQSYRISVRGTPIGQGILERDSSTIEVAVPAALTTQRTIVVTVDLPDAASASDGRLLALGLKRFSITRGPAVP